MSISMVRISPAEIPSGKSSTTFRSHGLFCLYLRMRPALEPGSRNPHSEESAVAQFAQKTGKDSNTW